MAIISEPDSIREIRRFVPPIPRAAPALSMWLCLAASWVVLSFPTASAWMIPGALLATGGLTLAMVCIARMDYFNGVRGIAAFFIGGGIALAIRFSLLAYLAQRAVS